MFLARVSSLAPNPNGAVPAVKAAVRSYRASESAARDLILTFWNILDQNLEGTASLVNALVEILDDEEKKNNLLGAWNGFKIEVCLTVIFCIFIEQTSDFIRRSDEMNSRR